MWNLSYSCHLHKGCSIQLYERKLGAEDFKTVQVVLLTQ